MAYLPTGVSNSSIRNVMLLGIQVLKEFQVKTLRRQFVDEILDAYPLACLYNLGVQILALREIQDGFRDEIWQWRNEVQILQDLAGTNLNNIGVVLAEAHEILIFAILVNRIHPVPILTTFSIECAAKKARDSPFLKEASYVISLLKAAFSIQGEIEKFEISEHASTHVISNAVSPPKTAIRVAREWYEDYEMPEVEKVSYASPGTRRG